MLDHLGLPVRDIERSRAFYAAALAPLGFGVVMEVTPEMTGGFTYLGFGPPARPHFWIGNRGRIEGSLHIAFSAESRAKVRRFYDAALSAGARDNGPPGLRPEYHPGYYGAFVFDPDGHNIEAVCHTPE
jgi:catechol 2,3-dioxygenase-like lactoylglutathione lyase family enzyme